MIPWMPLIVGGMMIFIILVYIHLRGMVCFNFLPMEMCGNLGMP